MAPASPDLRIIMRLWAASKEALRTQQADVERRWCSDSTESTRPKGRRKKRKEWGKVEKREG